MRRVTRQAIAAAAVVGLALLAAPAAHARALVPMPPYVHYVDATPEGWPADQDFRAATAGATVYYRAPLDRSDRYHELGHVFDWVVLSDTDRAALQRVMRRPGPWVPEDSPDDAPDECFAEWYMNARMGHRGLNLRRGGSWEVGYDCGLPSRRRVARFTFIVHQSLVRWRELAAQRPQAP